MILAVMFLAAAAAMSIPLPDTGKPIGLPPDKPLSELLLNRWTVAEGLPTTTIKEILYSRDGYLWISSYDGIFRFDGREFDAFRAGALPPLQTQSFRALAQDADETIWIGTQTDGLMRYRNGRFDLLPYDFPNEIVSLLIDREGTLWIGVYESGIYQYDGARAFRMDDPELDGITARAISQTRDGAIWFATARHGLIRRGGAHTENHRETHSKTHSKADHITYDQTNGLSSDRVTDLLEDADGALLVGSQKGLDHLDPSTGTILSIPELSGAHVKRLLRDSYGNLWLASSRGLIRRNALSGQFETLRDSEGETLGDVNTLSFDREGSLWFRSAVGELYQLRESRFKNYSISQGLTARRVETVIETRSGEYLIGTNRGVVHRLHDGQISTLALRTSLTDLMIKQIYQDSVGDLWITSDAGLLRISKEGQETLLTTRDGLPSDLQRTVYEDRAGNFWAGTTEGLARRISPDRFRPVAAGEIKSVVLAISEDQAGNLVLGTRDGLFFMSSEGKILNRYTTKHGLPSRIVNNVFIDSDGATWLCTSGGISRLLHGEIRTLGTANGLPTGAIFDYAEDDLGFVWLSSSLGVLRISKSRLNSYMEGMLSELHPLLLDSRDGMAGAACSSGRKILQASDSRLWFPTLGGISTLDPNNITLNSVPPPVVIHRFLVDGMPHDLVDSIIIPPGGKQFHFGFAALSLKIPSKNKMKYRLLGFDTTWRDAEGERAADYLALPPGEYTFEVIAANNDGIWNRAGARVRFRVERFFYETPLFFALMLSALGLGTVLIYRWRIRIVKDRNRQLEKLLEERRKAAIAEKASHESSRRFRSLFSEAGDAILVIEYGRVVDCNSRAREIYGDDQGELLGASIDELSPTQPDEGRISLAEALDLLHRAPPDEQRREAHVFNLQQKRCDGSTFEAELSLSAIEIGNSSQIHAFVRDISERIQLINELETKNREMERFLYTVSHDLKSPLFTIRGFLGMLEKDIDSGRTQRISTDLERIDKATLRMGRMLDELLELSRIGRVHSEQTAIPMSDLAHEAVHLVGGRILALNVEVETESFMPVLTGDRPRLLEVYQNLIDNAVKLLDGTSAPKLEIGTRRDEQEIVFFVRDNGPGIDPRYLATIFGLFEKLDPKDEGTGIGLAIVKQVIKVHGGRIWAESEGLGRGATFCFTVAATRILQESASDVRPLRESSETNTDL